MSIDTASRQDSVPPKRISFNFVDRCNMTCSFCYIPFDNIRVNVEVAANVIEVILRWSPASITVGGGDPLMYRFTPDLLRHIRDLAGPALFLQLDTNLMRPERCDLAAIAKSVDMVGVPLDTFDTAVAWQMRGNGGHPRQIGALIPTILRAGTSVKVNTVVARPNLVSLPELADFVAEANVQAWSLYEFWPIGPRAVANRAAMAVDHAEFRKAVEEASGRAHGVNVETGAIRARRSAYFFVTPTGRAYTVDGNDHSQYAELGNILEDEPGVLSRWHRHADEVVNEERVRQRAGWAHSGRLRAAGCHS